MTRLESGGLLLSQKKPTFSSPSLSVLLIKPHPAPKNPPFRFMPEPNLPPLIVYEDNASLPTGIDAGQAVVMQEMRKELPELPSIKRDRLVQTYRILPEHSFQLVVSTGSKEVKESLPSLNLCPVSPLFFLKNCFNCRLLMSKQTQLICTSA